MRRLGLSVCRVELRAQAPGEKENDPRVNERGVWLLTVDELLDIHGRQEIRVRV